MKRLIGGHISFKNPDYLLGAVKELIRIKGTMAAIFVGAPQSTVRKPLELEQIKEAHKLAKENGISIENFIVHAPYLANLATKDPSKWNFSVNFLTGDVKRTQQLGIKYFNIHPGANEDLITGIEQCAKGINKILSKTKDVTILLETVTAKGNLIGKTFDELARIIELVDDKSRIGVCMDTVHIWDAGYDIENRLEEVLESFGKIVGFKYLKGMHIGDSKNDLGSNKDRHEHLGKGKMGLQTILNVVNHPKLKHLPMALETPWDPEHHYKEEIELIMKGSK